MMKVGSCATDCREPRQVRKEAAVSGFVLGAAGAPDSSRLPKYRPEGIIPSLSARHYIEYAKRRVFFDLYSVLNRKIGSPSLFITYFIPYNRLLWQEKDAKKEKYSNRKKNRMRQKELWHIRLYTVAFDRSPLAIW